MSRLTSRPPVVEPRRDDVVGGDLDKLDQPDPRVVEPVETQRRSTTWSTQAVSASTSVGSIAGNIATRSWLRPSLRYGSTSTMPFARSVAATALWSMDSSKSIVPTTSERSSASVTNGSAYVDFSAQP